MITREYAAIILAAGFSKRMGTFKPLLPIGNETMAERVISGFPKNDVDIILVSGWRQDLLISGINIRDITLAQNPNFRSGMFSSILAGISLLRKEHKAFFIMPVDIPLVRPATINRLLKEAIYHPGKILYPAFNKTRGHPSVIPCTLVPAIKNWSGEGGLKTLLHMYEQRAWEVVVADSNILIDIDTPDDYRALLKRFQTYDIPTDEECIEILNSICKVDPERQRHCIKVSEIAVLLGHNLQLSGCKLNLGLIKAAAMLHDIAKGKPEHDVTGGKILREMGFDKVGEIVSVHSDLAGGDLTLPLEAKVVYLADKLVQGENLVTIQERYQSTGRRFALTPKIQNIILARSEVAQKVQKEIELLLGNPLQKIINQHIRY